jgi:Undecaprenyl-phosphate glucose phosphotransferase
MTIESASFSPLKAAWRTLIARASRNLLDWLFGLLLNGRGLVSRPKLLLVVAMADGLLVMLSGLAAEMLLVPGGGEVVPSLTCQAMVALIAIAMLRRNWSYTVSALRSRSGQMIKVLSSILPVFVALAGLSFIAGASSLTARQLVLWMALAIPALSLVRLLMAGVVEELAAAGLLTRRTVIAGGGKESEELIGVLTRDAGAHLEILGVFDDRQGEREGGRPDGMTRLGTFEELTAFCQKEGVDLVLVTVPPRAEERLLEILRKLFVLQVDIRVSAFGSKLRLNSSSYSYIGKVPMLAVMDKPLSDWDRVLKNIEDRVLGALILLAAAPVMMLMALAVRLDSKGPILFKQRRYGFNNELIEVFKFRSMYVDRADATASRLVTRDDPRVTPVGRLIRKTSLDELPQLFNVLLGQMSLVGPRPHATQAKAGADLYEDVVQGYFARHRVKPGVTGWAQINGWRGETDTSEKIQRRVEYDLYYIDHWSVLFDLYIIAVTPFALISGKNAY